jgi:hypothetical protein
MVIASAHGPRQIVTSRVAATEILVVLVGILIGLFIGLSWLPVWLRWIIVPALILALLYLKGSLQVKAREISWRLDWFFHKQATACPCKRHEWNIPAEYSTQWSGLLMFFIPNAERVTDPYLEALFGYFPKRLSDTEYLTTTIRLPVGRKWAFAYNLRVAPDKDVVLDSPIVVNSSDRSIAEIGQKITEGWILASTDYPMRIGQTLRTDSPDMDVVGFYEIIAKRKGKCTLNVTHDVLGQPQRNTSHLAVEVF